MATRKTSGPEKQIEAAILKYLSFMPRAKGFFWKNDSTGMWDKTKGVFRRSQEHSINGVSDILGIYMGSFVAIEVKAPRGRVSRDQDLFLNRVRDCGGIAGVCRSIDDVKQLLNIKEAA